jgi:MFS family permease
MIIIGRKCGPRWFLPTIVFLWGCLVIGAGWSPTWTALLGIRLILGVLESGFFPSAVYLISAWYTRCQCAHFYVLSHLFSGATSTDSRVSTVESAKRYSAFYLTGSCMAALASVVAYGLSEMNGIAGLSGWRW